MRETTDSRLAGEIKKVNAPRNYMNAVAICVAIGLVLAIAGIGNDAEAEYGDVVMNEYSDEAGMQPVVFPHWFHRIRFRCKACHGDLGFQFKAGANDVNKVKIIDGQYCGACHNGDVAWSIENCDLCHSGVVGMPTQVHHSTMLKLPEERVEDSTTETEDSSGEKQ